MKVIDLQPGYEIYDRYRKLSHMFVFSWPHPKYQGFMLVVWILGDGTWSFDALSPQQEVGEVMSASPTPDRQNALEELKGRIKCLMK